MAFQVVPGPRAVGPVWLLQPWEADCEPSVQADLRFGLVCRGLGVRPEAEVVIACCFRPGGLRGVGLEAEAAGMPGKWPGPWPLSQAVSALLAQGLALETDCQPPSGASSSVSWSHPAEAHRSPGLRKQFELDLCPASLV